VFDIDVMSEEDKFEVVHAIWEADTVTADPDAVPWLSDYLFEMVGYFIDL